MYQFYRAFDFNLERMLFGRFLVLVILTSSTCLFSAEFEASKFILVNKGGNRSEIPVIALSQVSHPSGVQVVKASDFMDALKFRRSIDIWVVHSSALRIPVNSTEFSALVDSESEKKQNFKKYFFQSNPFQRLIIPPSLGERYKNSHLALFLHLLAEKGALVSKPAPLGNRISDFNRSCLNTLGKIDFVRPIVGLGTIGLLLHFIFRSSPQYRYSRLVTELGCDESMAQSLLEQLRLCSSSSKTLSVALDSIPKFRKNGHSQEEIMEHARLAIYYCIKELGPNEKDPIR